MIAHTNQGFTTSLYYPKVSSHLFGNYQKMLCNNTEQKV